MQKRLESHTWRTWSFHLPRSQTFSKSLGHHHYYTRLLCDDRRAIVFARRLYPRRRGRTPVRYHPRRRKSCPAHTDQQPSAGCLLRRHEMCAYGGTKLKVDRRSIEGGGERGPTCRHVRITSVRQHPDVVVYDKRVQGRHYNVTLMSFH
jgi:hypothetical protein